ncbi:MAG TPA: iron-sulfur cluster repair di-iron protein [Bryobacteraceae bacterium]|nr:iron-sulfur cluster repair di-iron protein [Bryobacteraceae bacterium]
MTLTTEKTVREIAIENPATVRVFESLGIDYCCGGRRPLSEACQHANVPLERALELIAAAKSKPSSEGEWTGDRLAALTDHIVTRHHSFTRQELTRLEVLVEKVCSRHGNSHAELLSIQELLKAMSQELFAHMLKEEQVLFPYIERLECSADNGSPLPATCFGSVQMPIARMLAEHDDAGELLSQIRKLAGDFHAPEDACPSYRGLYAGLEEFERDLHRHIHLENNILFPRAVALERELLKPGR